MRYRLLIIFSIFCFVEAMAQDGRQKWAEPQLQAEWGLERMPHNNANPNVYVYKDKRYDALFTRRMAGTVCRQHCCPVDTYFGASTTASMAVPQMRRAESAVRATFPATA